MKKLLKKTLLVVPLLFAFQSETEAATPTFKDVPTKHWAYETIQEATKLGYFKGDGNGNFLPNNNVSRAEFAQILARMFDGETRVTEPFIDVDNAFWGKDAIEELLGLGIINANDYPNNRFEPSKPMTRSELSKWLTNALSVEQTSYTTIMKTIRDSQHTLLPTTEYLRGGINKQDQGNIGIMLGTGLFTGYVDGSFKPNGNTSRSEVAALAIRFKNMQDKSPTEFSGLNEIVEVSETATNMTSISPFKYPKYLNGLTFDSVTGKWLQHGNLGSVMLHHAIFVPNSNLQESQKSIYGKMFSDETTWFYDGTYALFTNKTFKYSQTKPLEILTYLNAHPNALLKSHLVTENVAKKFGYNYIGRDNIISIFKHNKEVSFWGSDNVPMRKGYGNGLSIQVNQSEFAYYYAE